MKKTVNINLGGRVFQIDDDAYHMLETYISNISALYRKEDPDGEIVQDFEQRLSDLLWESKYGSEAVITVEMTERAISRLGDPEEIQEESVLGGEFSPGEEAEKEAEERPSETDTKEETFQGRESEIIPRGNAKKFFRNPDDRWIGGVLGGLGAFFGVDPLFLRILFILLMFTPVNWVLIILYITFLCFIPKAKTVEDKLRMEGRPVRPDEIWKKISEEASFAADTAMTGFNKIGDALSWKDKPATENETQGVKKPKTRSDTAMYWVLGIAVILFVVLSIYWLTTYVSTGEFIRIWESSDGFFPFSLDNFGSFGSYITAFIAILIILIIFLTLLFTFFVIPLGLIVRSQLSTPLKVVLVLIWLALLSIFFL